MADKHDFTCRTCGAHFDSRDGLDRHNRREHSAYGQESEGSRERPRSSTDEPGSSAQRRTGEDWTDESSNL